MKKRNIFLMIKDIFTGFSVCLFGFTAIIFSVLYYDTFNDGFMFDYFEIFSGITVVIISIITVLTIILSLKDGSVIYKLFFIAIFFAMLTVVFLYIFRESELFSKIRSIEDLRHFISDFGVLAVVVYILICFMQVVILPIPGIITTGAGVLLFGPIKAAIFSFIGIVLGSYCAYFLGKVFGYKLACWLIGEKSLNKWQNLLKGKDKALFTIMFIFPFFPDEVLCFLAGIIKMPTKFFIIMITVVRLITSLTSTLAMNNSLIPFNTWWGILLWGILLIGVGIATCLIYKHAGEIENIFKTKKYSKNQKN